MALDDTVKQQSIKDDTPDGAETAIVVMGIYAETGLKLKNEPLKQKIQT